MSSDVYDVEVRAVDGTSIEFLCITTGAGGLNDYASTRSFALSLLADISPRSGAKKSSPLHDAVSALGGEIWDEAFHRANVDKFIVGTRLVAREGKIADEARWIRQRSDLGDALRSGPRFKGDIEAELDKKVPRHRFVLRAEVTDPKWLQGIRVGQRFGTTSYDAWWTDPVRPSEGEVREKKAAGAKVAGGPVKKTGKVAAKTTGAAKKTKVAAKKTATGAAKTATGAAKKTAAKKTAKGATGAAKKGAAKKGAAKKTAAKKTAAKKTAKGAAKKTAAKKTGTAKKTAAKTTKGAAKKTAR